MSRAAVYHRFGGPEVLDIVDLPRPKLAQDSVLIRAHAASVSPADLAFRAGVMKESLDAWFPVVPGFDVAGTVLEVGPGATDFAIGDEVIAYLRGDLLHYGGCAELVSTNVLNVVHKPQTASWTEATVLPLAGLTAYQAVNSALQVRAGETMLIHGGAGSVGAVAVQLACHLGARVLASAATKDRDFVRSLGAEPVSRGDGLVANVRRLSPGGVDVILDAAGHGVLDKTSDIATSSVRVVTVADSHPAASTMFVRYDRNSLSALVSLVDELGMSLRVGHTLPLDRVAEAHRIVEAGGTAGKVVLTF